MGDSQSFWACWAYQAGVGRKGWAWVPFTGGERSEPFRDTRVSLPPLPPLPPQPPQQETANLETHGTPGSRGHQSPG